MCFTLCMNIHMKAKIWFKIKWHELCRTNQTCAYGTVLPCTLHSTWCALPFKVSSTYCTSANFQRDAYLYAHFYCSEWMKEQTGCQVYACSWHHTLKVMLLTLFIRTLLKFAKDILIYSEKNWCFSFSSDKGKLIGSVKLTVQYDVLSGLLLATHLLHKQWVVHFQIVNQFAVKKC